VTKGGKVFRLYCLHPKPPVPGESDDSADRDAEILIVGKEAKKHKHPVIVAGDLNDVAWSYTTNLFLKVSELLDPRIGRGFFSTFHANYKLLRWPLDHVFCSSHFYLKRLKRLPSIGSDHFPIFIEVSLAPHEIKENAAEKKEADSEDHKLAEEKIEAAT
jgi:endonuclease/exonuclease/phosphatase (EEP) superfamily protein YafD